LNKNEIRVNYGPRFVLAETSSVHFYFIWRKKYTKKSNRIIFEE